MYYQVRFEVEAETDHGIARRVIAYEGEYPDVETAVLEAAEHDEEIDAIHLVQDLPFEMRRQFLGSAGQLFIVVHHGGCFDALVLDQLNGSLSVQEVDPVARAIVEEARRLKQDLAFAAPELHFEKIESRMRALVSRVTEELM